MTMPPRNVPRNSVFVAVAVVALVVLGWWSPVQQSSVDQVNAGLKRALVSYASARAINAVLSVVQGTDVAVQPFGIGITLALGKVIHPANHLVEQFGDLMLVAAVALGTEKVLLMLAGTWPVSAALTLVAACWLAMTWRAQRRAWMTRLFVLCLLVRFAMPTVVLGSDLVFRHFLEPDYAASQAVLQAAPQKLEQMTLKDGESGSARSVWDRVKEATSAPVKEVSQRYAALQVAVDRIVEHIVQMMVVFVLQTVVLPILIVWLLFRTASALVRAERSPPPFLARAGTAP